MADTRLQRRSVWPAVVLNLFAAPCGYVWAEAWWTALVLTVFGVLGAIALVAWTFTHPPGVYALGPLGWLPIFLVLNVAMAIHAGILARRRPNPKVPWTTRLAIIVAIEAVTIPFSNIYLRNAAPFPVYNVPSSSMEPTIAEGDIFVSDTPRGACAGKPAGRGVVIRQHRPSGGDFVRRVTGIPGDSVAVRGGLVILNGYALSPPSPVRKAQVVSAFGLKQLTDIFHETGPDGRSWDVAVGEGAFDGEAGDRPPVTLGPRQYFLLGDNRRNAIDSRSYGPVDQATICGVALKIVFSKDPAHVSRRP